MIWIIIFYVIPVILSWLYFHFAFSTRGRWSNLTPSSLEVNLVFIPFVNILVCIAWIFEYPTERKKDKIKHYEKFFLIK